MEYQVAEILDGIDAGIVTADASGRVRSVNAEAARLLERPISDVRELIGTEVDEEIASGGREVTLELQPSNEPARRLRVTRYEPPDSESATVLVLRDVTETRRLREAFMVMLSHELRTPVTSIYAAATVLRRRQGRLDATDQAELLSDIVEEGDRLLQLVEDLLVSAHLDEGTSLIQEPVLLQRCVPPVVERERRRWPSLGVDVRVESHLPVIAANEAGVQHVVRNLVSNAARYDASSIVVELKRADDADGAEVHVLDEGAGVESAEAVDQVDPRSRSMLTAAGLSGAGIGLSVCRQLVGAMGGRMWARQRDVGGSDCGFWLPDYHYEVDD